MQNYTQPIWGYQLNYPDEWFHRRMQGVDAFAPLDHLFKSNDQALQRCHLLIQPEWNGMLERVEPLWEAHIARVAGMIGAKNLGTASWELAGASGLEAEIVLPRSSQERLWVGMLPFEHILLKFMVYHPLQERAWFEPKATQIMKSLQFLEHVTDIAITKNGIPLPNGCRDVDPLDVIIDADDIHRWLTFEVDETIGAVQAFYIREALPHGWTIEEFMPYPNLEALTFARFRIVRGEQVAGVGLLPTGGQHGASGTTRIAIKLK